MTQSELEAAVARLTAERDALQREVAVDDQLLAEDKRLLDLFECPTHGSRCIPHAIDEVTRLRLERDALRETLTKVREAFLTRSVFLRHEIDAALAAVDGSSK